MKFTIRAEKCPNRRGVEEVLRHFQGDVIGFDEVVRQASQGQVRAMYVAGGYPPRSPGWISETQAAAFKDVQLLIVQDLFPSPLSNLAHYVIPASTFAEKEGTFVNHEGLAQALRWAVRPPRDCRTDGQVFLDLLERRGLWHAASLRTELARDVPFFAPLGAGDLGEQGLVLGGDSRAPLSPVGPPVRAQ